MSGFAKNACSKGLGMLENVMSGFKPDAIPVYACLADESAYKA
jgi:phospholipase C